MPESPHTPASDQALAHCFNISPRLLPYLDYLLQDFSALGGLSDHVTELLRQAELPTGARILDLGCGKGAVGLAVLQAFPTLQARLTGYDGYPPFIDAARARAEALGLGERCAFQVADFAGVLQEGGSYDLLLFLALGEALGDLKSTMAQLGTLLAPGGYLVIDYGYTLAGSVDFHGYLTLGDRDATLAQLTAHGHRVVGESLIAPEVMREQNRRYTAWLENRAAELTARHPELGPELATFLAGQVEECRILEQDVQCVHWLLQRRD